MTREEAINIISQMIKDEEGFLSDNTVEAHKMAVKTLEQEPCEDAVSREAVLGLFAQNADAIRPYSKTWEEVKTLSSVNPQHTDVEIQKMQELEQAEIQKAYELGKTEGQNSEDVISRQAAIDAMYALCDTGETLKENPWRDNPHIDAVVETIEQIPSVNPQQRVGHWIDDGQYADGHSQHAYRCSKCGGHIIEYEPDDFCKFCGAKMVEPQESEG